MHLARSTLLTLLLAACGSEARVPPPAGRDASTDAGASGRDAAAGLDAGTPGADAAVPGTDAGAAASLEACMEGLAPRPNRFVEILQLRTRPAGYRVILAREPGDRPGAIGETFPLDLIRFAVETPTGERTCVTDRAQLSYTFGHHNWNEHAEITVGARRYVLELRYFNNGVAAWDDILTVQDSTSGAVLEGPLTLEDEACRSIPLDLNTCFQRPRT